VSVKDFGSYFDRFRYTAFRLEALPSYDIADERDEFEAWLRGEPLPDRSVRTDPWLGRIALSTMTQGKRWRRAHVVDVPLSEYLRFELAGYAESQAAGEEIRIAVRGENPALATLPPDFWLFDAGTRHACALEMSYDRAGVWLGFKPTRDRARIRDYEAVRDMVWNLAVPLNTFQAVSGGR
jgi:hypothetical protein